jgi:hypothetical protein
MSNQFKMTLLTVTIGVFSGCVPMPKPQTNIGIGRTIGQSTPTPQIQQQVKAPEVDSEYGAKPSNYILSIRNYFSNKIPRANLSQFKYSQPKRAYKRKGFAYGGAVAWRGWLVEVLVATPTRTGRLLTPKPYMVLFSGNQVVEHILGRTHKLIVKVDK